MMNSPFDLSGKVALVTGASGGLGSHFARVLSHAGATVGLAARRVEKLQALADEIGNASVAAMDVTDASSVSEAISAIESTLGPVDILVNNSGISIAKPALEHSEADWDAVIDVNLKGAFLVATETARRMRARGSGGSIINIESILSFRQAGSVASYAASKAGLTQLTRPR
jgi:NAD(P)-dependent dehydrogenase (short-subunit alcohol dehydrogenase family)